MRFELSQDRRALRDTAREFLADRCPLDFARECDESGTFPRELFRELGKLGWQGIPYGAQYGGAEGDPLDEAVVVEQLGRAMGPLASSFVISVLTCGKTLRDLGTETQKEKWLPPIITGESLMAFALTEPEAGSDAAAITSRAVRTETGWVLNGQKIFCTGASISDRLLVMMRTSDLGAKSAIGMFVVDTDTPGLTIQNIPKLGLHPYPSCMLFFDDVYIDDDCLLGDPAAGWTHLVSSLNRERLAISAMCTGMAQAALDVAAQYVTERRQFGQAIGDFPAVRQHVARMVIAVESARALMLRAAQFEASGVPSTVAASMAKVRASDAAVDAARFGMQVLGGYSYTMEYPMQRFLRDALIHPIAGGSNEIQRNIVAQELLGGAGEITQYPGVDQAEAEFAAQCRAFANGWNPGSNEHAGLTTSPQWQARSARPAFAALVPEFIGIAEMAHYDADGALALLADLVVRVSADDVPAEPRPLLVSGDDDPAFGTERLEQGSAAHEPGGWDAYGPGVQLGTTGAPVLLDAAGLDRVDREVVRDVIRAGLTAALIGVADEHRTTITTVLARNVGGRGQKWAGQAVKHRLADGAMGRDVAWLELLRAVDAPSAGERGRHTAIALHEALTSLGPVLEDAGRAARATGDEATLATIADATALLALVDRVSGGSSRLRAAISGFVLGEPDGSAAR